jgi:hypothetical protein
MTHSPLLAAVVALVLWSFVMCAWLYATRIPAIRQKNIGVFRESSGWFWGVIAAAACR